MISSIRRLPWRVIIPWFLFVVAAAGAVVFFLQWQTVDEDRAREDEVRQVSTDFVLALTNFSHETIREDVEDIRSYAVGEFAEELGTYFGDDGIEAIEQAEAVSEAQVEAIFVQSVDEDEASVFAVVRETITNTTTTDPQTDTVRLEIGLVRTAEAWKVTRVQVFQSPGTGAIPEGLG